MPAAAHFAVCEAIASRARLAFRYHGLPRVVEPYCYGVSSAGKDVLRAVQVGGESKSGGFGYGKLWVVADLRDAKVLPDRFAPTDPDYNPADTAMTRIYCFVAL
ncbi:MAG TPA: hypothetical protein VGM88_16910 [Kofleriaceae bacterium]|jgi:hypothetical protein